MKRISNPRWVMAALVLVTVALVVGGGLFYRAQKQSMRHEAEADLLTIAGLKVDQIVAWRAQRLGDAAVLMEDLVTCETAADWLVAPDPDPADRILTHFRSLRDHYHYHDIQLVDANGRVRLSLSGRLPPLHEGAVRDLDVAWRERRPVLVDLSAGPPGQSPFEEVIAPFYEERDGKSVPAGAFILKSDAEQFLYPLIQSWPRSSESAETLLVRKDGDSVLFLNELRHQKHTALTLRIPLSQTDLPAVMAVKGQRGIVQGVDYRGVPVFAALTAVPESPWFMVAKVDQSEALAVWHSRAVLILAMFMGLAAAAVATVGVVWQRSQKEHFQLQFEAESALRAAEAGHQVTLMSVGDGVIVTDLRGDVKLMNPTAERLTGWSRKEAIGNPLADVFNLVDEETRRRLTVPLKPDRETGRITDHGDRHLLLDRSGHAVPVAETIAPIRDDRGGVSGFVLVIRDQTNEHFARRLTEIRLALIEYSADHSLGDLLTRAVDEVAAFSNSPVGFYHFVDSDQRTISLQRWSTRTIEEFCTAEGDGLHYDVDQAGVWADCIATREPVVHNDYASLQNKRGLPEGHAPVIRELVVPVIRDDRVVSVLGVGNKPVDYTQDDVDVVSYLADVTWQIVEQKQADETITRMAYHDPLTDLPNRLLFNDRLTMALTQARRNQDRVAVAVLDLDRFKEVNDTFGHGVGDKVLQLAGERLKSLVRESDTVARMGGDEFCLVLPGLAGPDDAGMTAQKIVRGFEEVFHVEGAECRVTASVGFAVFPDDGDSIDTLIRNADRAMYRVKRSGRSNHERHGEPGAGVGAESSPRVDA